MTGIPEWSFISTDNRQIQRKELGTVFGPTVALFPLEAVCPADQQSSVSATGSLVTRKQVVVSSRVVERQLLPHADVPTGKQRQSGDQRVHAHWLHHQVRPAGVVQEATHIPHGSRVNKCLCDGAAAAVLPHGDDVVAVGGFLAELPASRLLETDHLPCILAHKCPTSNILQCPNSPALVLGTEHLQLDPEAPLDHSVAASITAAAEDIAFEHGGAVVRVDGAQVDQFACFAVCLTVCLQARAALDGAGAEWTGASGQSDLTGVDGASWSLDVIWGVLVRMEISWS